MTALPSWAVVTLEEDMLTFRSLLVTVPTNLTPETTNVE